LKTLRIYDDEANFRHIRTIVLETMPKDIYAKEPLPNYLHFRDSIYYFKRIYIKDEENEEENKNKDEDKDKKDDEDKQEDDNQKEEEKVPLKEVKSYLQLFRYRLTADKESRVKDFVIWENDYFLCPLLNKNFGEKFIIYSDNEQYNKVILDNLEKAK